jgi:ABC-type uncharacterized transport system ATPase subunit
MGMKMVELEKVSFCYPKAESFAVKDVSINIQKGEIVGLLGRNGAGKTTLVKLISGLYEPMMGEVRIMGQAPGKNADVRRKLGVMHQQPGFDQMLTGWVGNVFRQENFVSRRGDKVLRGNSTRSNFKRLYAFGDHKSYAKFGGSVY